MEKVLKLLPILVVAFAQVTAWSPLGDRGLVANTSPITRNTDAYRLPTAVRPSRYQIALTPTFYTLDDNAFTFTGIESIYVSTAEENTYEITLHAEDLTIQVLLLYSIGPDQVNTLIPTTHEEGEYNFLVITLNDGATLTPNGNYRIDISFRGNLQTDMSGFYRSWYRNEAGTISWMGTTQFQAGSARKAFPSFDEPGFKAVFDITIDRPEEFAISISNMPVRESIALPADNRIRDIFHTTPVMSTYLIAFIVSEFEGINVTPAEDPRPFGIHARTTARDQGQYAFDVGQKLLQAMDDITTIPYYDMAPNMKMDQAGIPDFSAGAMENWGLLTYREAYLLGTEEDTNDIYFQFISSIISHEIAHMWYGNLVTCHWWSDLWLNEGFASYYEFFLTDKVEPEKRFDLRFVSEYLHPALNADALASAHPLSNQEVFSPSAVSAHFSTITYSKGSSVIRMVEHLVGHEEFETGLTNYLNNNAFDTSVPADLYADWQAAAVDSIAQYPDLDIPTFLTTWVDVAGFPLLTVTVNRVSGEVTFQQRSFNEQASGENTLWYVPVSYATYLSVDFEDTKPQFVMSTLTRTMDLGVVDDGWVIVNKQATGFYRVTYDDATWDSITALLRSEERSTVHTLNRAQIVNDVFALAQAGEMTYVKAFDILSFLEFETDYMPWIAAIAGFNVLRRRLAAETVVLASLHEFIFHLADAAATELGYVPFETEDYLQGILRLNLMSFLCSMGHEGCIASAVEQYSAWREEEAVLPPNVRNWVYCNGLRHGQYTDYQYLWLHYGNVNVYSEKVVILGALGCTDHDESIRHLLNRILLDTEGIRDHDISSAFTNAVNGNERNSQVVFAWLRSNIIEMSRRFPSLFGPLQSIVNRLITEEDIITFESWLVANEGTIGASVVHALDSSTQVARNNLEWTSSRLAEILDALDEGTTTTETQTTTELATETPEVTDPDGISTPDPNNSATETPEVTDPDGISTPDPDGISTPDPNNSATTLKCTALLVSFAITYLFT